MARHGLALLVFLISFVRLAWNVSETGLASGSIDTVGGIAAQDEAVYSHIALRMADEGDWLTPKFLGRYVLFKPPLLYWASAVAVKLIPDTPLALRLPSILAGALAAALLFLWIGGLAGLLAAMLLLSNPLWHILSRLAVTDALLALWITLAVAALPRRSYWQFTLATAAALMTKGIAGLVPVMALALWWLLEANERKPSWKRWAASVGAACVLASPWFLYQWWTHPKWFWAEFVSVEILGFTLGAPPQTTPEPHIWFYGKRLLWTDPLLCLLAAAALPVLRRERWLAAWLAAVTLAVAANGYRNIAYVLPAIPALCWAAAAAGPLVKGRRASALFALLAVIFVVRIQYPDAPWGLSFRKGTTIAAAPALDRYARLGRPNELILVEPDDQFYATTLRLPRVRYCFLGPEESYRRYGLDFRYLGIALSEDEFRKRAQLEPEFRRRLAEWGLDSSEPIGTVILARTAGEAAALVAAEPGSDFVVPERTRALLPNTHEIREAGPGLLFLLAREATRPARDD